MISHFSDPLSFVFGIIGLLVAITIHEFSHAFIANELGDPTARLKGRMTLNPLAHLDPIGTLMLLFAGFGWGKPVPVDPYNLREPRKDSALISLAGPISNLVLATILALILKLNLPVVFSAILIYIVILNVSLAFFNLLPIFPLDGFSILEGVLPEDLARTWHSFQSLGTVLILFLLIMPGSPLSGIISPPINFVLKILLPLNGGFL